MRIHPHSNYLDYKNAQIEKNIIKFGTVWAKKEEIKACCNYMDGHNVIPTNGICHGVRNGWEIIEFNKLIPGCHIVGTDISYTITKVQNGIEHDFHDIREEWVATMDFVYSNSLDHAFDPIRALSVWTSQLRMSGILFVGWFEKNGIDKADCFLANTSEIMELIQKTDSNYKINVVYERDKYKIIGARL